METDLLLGMNSLLPFESEDDLLNSTEEEDDNSSIERIGASEDKKGGVGVLGGTSQNK